ncbi:MAG: primosomal protein N' [Candidatus Omnitrophica bacterium]|nr:primosomal protein N' [Candidatus Omnitrophota bacterium]
MIAQVVFDLPLEGPFDYFIPEHLLHHISVGTRIKASFGARSMTGFVVALSPTSAIPSLKPVLSLPDKSPFLNDLDVDFAREFSAYYGCTLGEALFTSSRNRDKGTPSVRLDHTPLLNVYACKPLEYAQKIKEIIGTYQKSMDSKTHRPLRFLVLVPDVFRLTALAFIFEGIDSVKIGTRSSVFESDARFDAVMMVDEEDPSYKEEQTPMYETRQVLLMRAQKFGFDVHFIGLSPSLELMARVYDNEAKYIASQRDDIHKPRLVDLTNYKFVPGLISPPVRDALEAALKAGKPSVLVLNRKGLYRLIRCTKCAHILKCAHCDTSMIYSRAQAKFLCRHCTYTLPPNTLCPQCQLPSWKFMGIGVEQVQTELKKIFPQARVATFERPMKMTAQKTQGLLLPAFDILIGTQAVLRFQATLKAGVAAFIDFDAELSRLDMRSAFHAFCLERHISAMADQPVFIQTRNPNHYLLKFLSEGKIQEFYKEELRLRKEFGFSPFKHWVKISWRGASQKMVQEAAQEVYNKLTESLSDKYVVTPPLSDVVERKRDQFRINVMVQAFVVKEAVAFIKSVLGTCKRRGRVIVTLNIDP